MHEFRHRSPHNFLIQRASSLTPSNRKSIAPNRLGNQLGGTMENVMYLWVIHMQANPYQRNTEIER